MIFKPWALPTLLCSEISVCVCVCVCAVAQLYLTLCDPKDCHPPGSSVQGVSQARILEWVAISFSRGSSRYGEPVSPLLPALVGGFFTTVPPGHTLDNGQYLKYFIASFIVK